MRIAEEKPAFATSTNPLGDLLSDGVYKCKQKEPTPDDDTDLSTCVGSDRESVLSADESVWSDDEDAFHGEREWRLNHRDYGMVSEDILQDHAVFPMI